MPRPARLLRAVLLKRISPIGVGMILLFSAISIGLMAPKIFAATEERSTSPVFILKQSPTIPEPSPAVSVAAINDSVSEEFDPYQTDQDVYNSEVEYMKALEQDAERRFYTNLVRGNERVVEAVYTYATDLNKDLVFALLLGESDGKPDAFNKNIDPETGLVVSIDRGLFQLNSLSYPNLTAEEAYQIETNAKYGIAHIRDALHHRKGNVRKALWDYNAGENRCSSNAAPAKTLRYANEVIANTKAIKQEREAYIKDSLTKYLAVSYIKER